MEQLQIKNKTISSNNLATTHHIENLLRNTQDGIIAFDLLGKIIAINPKAAKLFNKSPNKLINQNIWQQLKLYSYPRKRQFIQARNCFQLAIEGIAQQFIWTEFVDKKPVLSYNIMINKTELHGTSVIFARITDVLQAKIIEWALWSLAKISNHYEIDGVIDEILKLISNVFSADFVSVCLLNNNNIARTVSYYESGEKKENKSYSLDDSCCDKIILEQPICHFNDVQQKFPNDSLLKARNINSYLAGSITNQQKTVVGLLNVQSKQKIERNNLNKTLFRLFLGKVNLEIERLLNQRKLQFLASIPQQDPNPVIRVLPSGEVIFANAQGKVIVQHWLNQHFGLPEQLLKEAQIAQTTEQVVRIEMEADHKFYLFTLIWIAEFNQINIYGTDITQLKTTEQDMFNLARFDALTQIANRQYFEENLIKKIEAHHLNNQTLALLLIDLDNFKIINDTLGHPIGDLLLKASTRRMDQCLRQDDFIARLGGDEFIVLLNKSNVNSAIIVAEKIIKVLARPFHFGENKMEITASIGIACYPETGLTASELLKNADIAMYEAKKAGKNNFAVFSNSSHYVQNKRNETIKKDLKLAVAKNELFIEYQPQIDINFNKIIGFEALIRWHHLDHGLVLPNEFVPMAEQTGCIQLIGKWLLTQLSADYATLLSSSSDGQLSINVSLSQLMDVRFIELLCDSLSQYKINKNKIILDIAERTIAPHYKQITKSLKTIHDIGIQICLDNFGSSQVALNKLFDLPLDFIKLDQQLLYNIETSKKNRTLLKGIINLAKDLNIKVIQKGIETAEQHQIVKALGCPYAQGYYYCRPIKINELETFFVTSQYSLEKP